MDRRLFLAGLAALGACTDNKPQPVDKIHQKRMAITMDDFNLGFDIGLSRKERHENISEAFYGPVPVEPTLGRNWLTLKSIESKTEVASYPEQYLGFGRKQMDALGL